MIGSCAGWSVSCRSAGRSVSGRRARAWLSAINSSDSVQAERRVVQAERAHSVVSSAWVSFAVGRAPRWRAWLSGLGALL